VEKWIVDSRLLFSNNWDHNGFWLIRNETSISCLITGTLNIIFLLKDGPN